MELNFQYDDDDTRFNALIPGHPGKPVPECLHSDSKPVAVLPNLDLRNLNPGFGFGFRDA